tara:strand:+ start:4527 stop:4949 length:423 start_codon:yes stop_codon:yes gene_type:complete
MKIYQDNILKEDISYDIELNINKIYKNENIVVKSIYELSDESVKINKKKINYPLERLNLVSGYFYNRIDDDNFDRQHVGLIAQEVEKILPEVVIKHNGKKNISYNRFVSLLVECVKENTKMIKSLKEDLCELNRTKNEMN